MSEIIEEYYVSSPERNFAAETTQNQLVALRMKLCHPGVIQELGQLSKFINVSKSKSLIPADLKKWIYNSWNTELILNSNKIIIDDSDHPFAIQWAIPQAYYSIFCSLLAMYKVLGFTEMSHAAVRKKVADLIKSNYFPPSISFYCTGYEKFCQFINIEKPVFSKKQSSVSFDLRDEQSVDKQICQFLKSTRKHQVDEIKNDKLLRKLKIVNKTNGLAKKSLNRVDWGIVAEKVHETTILDLLYRKRIKSNYGNIDLFTSEDLDGVVVLRALTRIVDKLCLINEAYVYRAIGKEEYLSLKNSFMPGNTSRKEKIEDRFKLIENII